MSFLNTKGIHDIHSVVSFTKSASELGLLEKDETKLHNFLGTAIAAGALETGKLNMEDVTNIVSTLQDKDVLPLHIEQPEQVVTLLHEARNLGMNSTNLIEKIAAVRTMAKKLGLDHLGSRSSNKSDIGENQEDNGSPADAGKAITWHKLHFSPYNFKDILEVKITQGINEHARLFISGTLTDAENQESKDYVQMTEKVTPVSLYYIDNAGADKCLFKGMVTNIRQRKMGGLKYLDIEAVSFSYQLDTKKHSRSFQRHQEPYSYVFQRVNDLAREYVDGLTDDVLAAQDSEANQQTNQLIIQYQESDWQFLKRVASFFNIGLTPDITFDTPKIYFGLPPEPQQEEANDQGGQNDSTKKQEQQGPELNVSTYQIHRNTAKYAVSTENSRKNKGLTFSENDFTYCEAQSLDLLQLGQKVAFLEMTWYIQAIHTTMEKGAVNNTYTLTTQQGLMQDDLYNTNLAGVSLQNGVVKEVVKDEVRVHITDIDEEWDDGATWFFPYTTIYSSPDGSGWYCMPEIGDNVRIYFSNNKEVEAVAASSVNLSPSKRGARTDPDTKIISTVHGKQIILTPGGISIIANGNLLMTLTDDGGVNIKSDKKIILEAKEDIKITSKTSKVLVTGKNEINLSQGGGTISIKENIKISGNKVKMQP